MDITNPEIEKYLTDLIPDRDEVLLEMEKIGYTREFPIVGPLVGRLLYQMVRLTGARKIFEMGSGFGYSAYWMAKAMSHRGDASSGSKIICTDGKAENARQAMEFFKRGGVADYIDFRVGDAIAILDAAQDTFDLIFNDIDKESYPLAFEKAMKKLRTGGLLITDNVLWYGRVLDPKAPDASTRGVQEYNRLIYRSEAFISNIIPIRDGVALSLKIR
ncbi:MAG: O-methyltransferase [Candidatus Hadarchaeum sp.]